MQNSKKDQLLHKSSCGALLRKGEQEDQVYHLIIIIIIKKDIFIKKYKRVLKSPGKGQ